LKGKVSGIAEMDGIVYVVCEGSQVIKSYRVDYDSLMWQSNRPIVVDGLEDASDLVACAKTRRLYIADRRELWVMSPTSHIMVSHRSHVSDVF